MTTAQKSWSAIAAIGTLSEGKVSMPMMDSSSRTNIPCAIIPNSIVSTIKAKSSADLDNGKQKSEVMGENTKNASTTTTATKTNTTRGQDSSKNNGSSTGAAAESSWTSLETKTSTTIPRKNPWKIVPTNRNDGVLFGSNDSKKKSPDDSPTPAESKDMKAPIRKSSEFVGSSISVSEGNTGNSKGE